MQNSNQIFCFRASCHPSTPISPETMPDWLSVGTNWQGYRISTVPWVADVARIVGALQVEDTPESWIAHLESLGFREIVQVSCEDFFEDKLYGF